MDDRHAEPKVRDRQTGEIAKGVFALGFVLPGSQLLSASLVAARPEVQDKRGAGTGHDGEDGAAVVVLNEDASGNHGADDEG
ncbi:hypothetical protein ACFY78_20365 [Streptomyces olindensis]|uniref:hypothetical protein n=1 Tax=Streptomyces olindensis TaxID=358823 RepID=UPI00367B798B